MLCWYLLFHLNHQSSVKEEYGLITAKWNYQELICYSYKKEHTRKTALTSICFITLLTLSRRTSDFSLISLLWFQSIMNSWRSSALLPIIRESKTATSSTWEREGKKIKHWCKLFFSPQMTQMTHTPFELLLMRRIQVLTLGDSLSSSSFLALLLLLRTVSSSSSSVLSLWSGSGGRQKSCFRPLV